MSYDLEEQEQLENIKHWWKLHGDKITKIITVALLFICAFFAYRIWENHKQEKAYSISEQISIALEASKHKEAVILANTLLKDYPSSKYTAIGVLKASQAATSTMINERIALLKSLSDNMIKDNKAYATLAQYRQAGLLIENNKPDEAIAILTKFDDPSWDALFADRIADAFVLKKEALKAKPLYEKALKLSKESQNKALQAFIELKMDIAGIAVENK
jgi:predicted negative regulator of RcsB-dependent stress response